jgi:hypothetical protein
MAPELHTALMAVADAPGRQVVSTDRLGRWLRKIDGRIVSGRAIRQAGVVDGYPRCHWCDDTSNPSPSSGLSGLLGAFFIAGARKWQSDKKLYEVGKVLSKATKATSVS